MSAANTSAQLLDRQTVEAFNVLCQFVTGPIYLLTVGGDIVAANKLAGQVGLPTSGSLFDSGLDQDRLRGYLTNCSRVGSPLIGQMRLRTADGVATLRADGLRWGTATASQPYIVIRLTSAQSATRHFTALNQRIEALNAEVVRRRKAERAMRESEEKFRLLADTIPQLAWMARPDGYISWHNRRWYEYTGTTPRDMEGWGWQAVLDPDILPEVMARWKGSIATGEPLDMVFPMRGADGRFRTFLTRVAPLRDDDGTVVYWFGTSTDVSEIKALEAQLRETDTRKNQFLALLAHELRNPLAPIRSAADMLHVDESRDVVRSARNIISRQVAHMVRLVDDLLDASRITTGKLSVRRERVVLQDVISESVETAQPHLHGRVFTQVLPQEPIYVHADRVRIAQVISNLLNNACKVTATRGHVQIEVVKQGSEVLIRVQDDGFGIAPENIERVFELFTQFTPSREHPQEGLGIGLPLARAILEMHGGTIQAKSEGIGKGSTFEVRLPMVDAFPPVHGVESGDWKDKLQLHRFLVVDDNRDAADSLASLLRLDGHAATVAYDGAEALRKARDGNPDVVLLDIGMPNMDGYEACRAIRRQQNGDVVIIAVSGWGQESDRIKATQAGFDRHLTKPVEYAALSKLLASLLLQRIGQ